MKYYYQYHSYDLFDQNGSLSGLNKSNRWVKLADSLPWNKIEEQHNKRLRKRKCDADDKLASMVVGALIVNHVKSLSDEKTIQTIQENSYMQYLVSISWFTNKLVFVPELFVLTRKRLEYDFFNMLTLMLADADGNRSENEGINKDGIAHGDTLKIDATCCDAEIRFPTDTGVFEDGSKLANRSLDRFCVRLKMKKPQTHRVESRKVFLVLSKKKRKGKKLVDKIGLIQLRCLQAYFQTLIELFGRQTGVSLSCFSKHDYKCLWAAFKMYEQKKMMMMLGKNVRSCASRIISICQPHLRAIVRDNAKAKAEFVTKIGAGIVNGYTYVNHLSWDTAYNEFADLITQLELCRKCFGMLPKEIQTDKIYLVHANRQYIKDYHVDCYNRPLGKSPKDGGDGRMNDRKKIVGERNEIESIFGTSKRVYRANDIRAKLNDTADAWIGTCFFAKNTIKFPRGFICLIFSNLGLKILKNRIIDIFDYFPGVFVPSRKCATGIN